MHYWSLAEVSAKIRSRAVLSVEVTRHILNRIELLDSRYESFITVLSERALVMAAIADTEISKGFWRGPLHGVPITLKDVIFTDYAPTTGGMAIYADHVPAYTATVAARMERAGAVVLGKVKTVEGAWTEHRLGEAAPINPWHSEYWTGASSSGSGVSTAIGLGYGSVASDTGGSIRFPAQSCGLTGIKPTWGRVSRYGVFPLAASLDHVGPMARSAEDAGIMLSAMAGFDSNDPSTLSTAVGEYAAGPDDLIHALRIGVDPAYVYEGTSDDVLAAVKEAERVFTSVGAQIRQVVVPPYRDAVRAWSTLLNIQAAHAHHKTYPARAVEYGPALAGLIETGRSTSSYEVADCLLAKAVFTNRLAAVFDDVDVILVPVTPAGALSKREVNELRDAAADEFVKYTSPYNLSGYPTITLPAGFDRNGLPIAIQLVGPKLSESTLCRMGAAFQRQTDWHTRHSVE